MKEYESSLRNLVPATNHDHKVVLNIEFSQWADHIDQALSNRECVREDKIRYKEGVDKKLLKLALEHERNYRREFDARNTAMFTHPLYLSMTNIDDLTDTTRIEYLKYLKNLFDILYSDRDRNKLGIVVFETLHHYLAVTSLLLENGIIDRVLITEYDGGEPINAKELDQYSGNHIFFGGCYNYKCLETSIEYMLSAISNEDNVKGIKELILNSPQIYNDTLVPSSISKLSSFQIISLDEFRNRFSIEEKCTISNNGRSIELINSNKPQDKSDIEKLKIDLFLDDLIPIM